MHPMTHPYSAHQCSKPVNDKSGNGKRSYERETTNTRDLNSKMIDFDGGVILKP